MDGTTTPKSFPRTSMWGIQALLWCKRSLHVAGGHIQSKPFHDSDSTLQCSVVKQQQIKNVQMHPRAVECVGYCTQIANEKRAIT